MHRVPSPDSPIALASLQGAFCAHLRDPERVAPPADIAPNRARIYSNFVFYNMLDFFRANFPKMAEVLGEDGFAALIRDYIREHRSQTALYAELPGELITYLHSERQVATDPPFLFELAHYEYMESVIGVDTREASIAGIDRDGDVFSGEPVLSPLVIPLAYRFPVHQIDAAFQPSVAPPEPTYIVAYRDLDDREGYMHLNRVSARLLERLLNQPGLSGREHCLAIVEELAHPEPEEVLAGGRGLLLEWRQRDIVLGTRSHSGS